MITFSNLGKLGRLGNVLWQYAALRGIGLKTNNEIAIPSEAYEWHGQKCLLKYFKLSCRKLSGSELDKIIQYNYTNLQDAQRFDPELLAISPYTDLFGYFQNMRYFDGYEDDIRQEFQFVESLYNLAKDYHQNLRKTIGSNPLISIHVRRGDVVLHAQRENVDLFSMNGLYTLYLQEAFDIIQEKLGKDVNFLVFTGGNRGVNLQFDMEWCRQYIRGKNIYYCENMQDIEDFAIMSMCNHNINSPSTSFGWWTAFLNPNPAKIVIAPKYYHWTWRNEFPKDFSFSEFYPKDWIII